MAALTGRSIKVQWNGVQVAGVRTKSLSINGSPIDTTTDDDAGIRQLLSAPGQVDVQVSVSGILTSDELTLAGINSTSRTATLTFLIPGAKGSPDHQLFTGSFFITSFGITGEYNGAATFEAEFQSAGTVTLS